MNPLRTIYNRLSSDTRGRIRNLLPGGLLRWYSHRNTDIYLLSYPKCGRTWLRLMMGKAITEYFALPENEDILFLKSNMKYHPNVPRIRVMHDDHPMFKAPEDLEQSKERYRDKKVVFLVRDPRDVIVSSYFEMSKRRPIFGDNPHESHIHTFTGSLSEFINGHVGGFDTLIQYYNIWERNRRIPKGFLLVRYEDMRANPHAELRRVLDFIDLAAISDTVIDQAIEYASFDNMRKMESDNKFQSGMLNPADKADQDSYKTRKGKVKGFSEDLSPSEIQVLNQKMQAELADFFGYRP